MVKQEEKACTGCHNDKSPTFDASKALDYEKGKGAGTHAHTPLEQREE